MHRGQWQVSGPYTGCLASTGAFSGREGGRRGWAERDGQRVGQQTGRCGPWIWQLRQILASVAPIWSMGQRKCSTMSSSTVITCIWLQHKQVLTCIWFQPACSSQVRIAPSDISIQHKQKQCSWQLILSENWPLHFVSAETFKQSEHSLLRYSYKGIKNKTDSTGYCYHPIIKLDIKLGYFRWVRLELDQ